MGWFKRIKEGITTSTKEKKETPAERMARLKKQREEQNAGK